MRLPEAMRIAKTIMAKRPYLILCGSVALAHLGILKRDLGDIDFVCFEDEFDPTGFDTYGDYGPWVQDGHTCYKVSSDHKANGFYYNVFVFKDRSEVEFKISNGIKVQSPKQIIAWKKKYDRAKDIRDVCAIQKEYSI